MLSANFELTLIDIKYTIILFNKPEGLMKNLIMWGAMKI